MAVDTSTRNAIDDALYDGFSDLDDVFDDKPTLKDQRDDKPTLSPRAAKRKAGEDGDAFGLGLDEEVKIAKKRVTIAKLDEARLLSEPGIPKLRTLVRSKQISRRLRLKGKGHEFNDAAKLLNYFQLWLDDLYPRAKFVDALSMAEKAGHTKRMQMIRCEWIDEGKPGYIASVSDRLKQSRKDPDLFGPNAAEDDADHRTENVIRSDEMSHNVTKGDSLFIPDTSHTFNEDRYHDPDDDELEALLAEENEVVKPRQSITLTSMRDDSEGEDDLDALLAEQDTRKSGSTVNDNMEKRTKNYPQEEEYDDDLDALLAEQENTQQSKNSKQLEDENIAYAVETDTSHDSDHDVQLPLEPSPNEEQEQVHDANQAEPPAEELVEGNFLSSSPLPNDDMVDGGTSKGAPSEKETGHPRSDHTNQDAEISAQIDDIKDAGMVEQGELEEDFLSSSPIDLS